MPRIQLLDYLILSTKLLISMLYYPENLDSSENPKYCAQISQSDLILS